MLDELRAYCSAVEALPEIEALAQHRGRSPGTDAERRAARDLEGRLRDLGRDARTEPIRIWPSYALTHLIHATAAIAGSVLAVSHPLAATVVLLVTALSAFGELTGWLHLARRLTPRRASQNVVSPEDGGRAGTLVLVAHYDAARTGAAFGPRLTERRAALGKLVHRPIGPFEPFFWSIFLLLACAVLRLAGVDSTPVAVVQFAATVVLIVSVPLLADILLSGVTPGANDNASGVATVLRLAERYGGDLDHFDVWVLLTGAGESMSQGMREWVRAHRRELDPTTTAFLCVDEVGAGTVRYRRREGFLIAPSAHRDLVALCDQVAADDEQDDRRYGARSVVARVAGDAYRARARGFPAVTVTCANGLDYVPRHHQPTDTPENLDPAALERAFGFCSELVELIDERIGPQLAGG